MTGRAPVARHGWVDDLKVAFVVLVAILVSSLVADGAVALVVMFAVVIVVGLLLRLGVGRRSARDRKRRRRA
jgi:hypothetical protein